MSSPSINRWGLNLFWYRFWYKDKNNAQHVHQDHLINNLLSVYLQYGLLHTKNIFFNKYWYTSLKKNVPTNYILTNVKYFRLVEYRNRVLNEFRSYKIRNKLKNIYFSKIWILRYQNWLVTVFYAFQPVTNRSKQTRVRIKDVDFFYDPSGSSYLLYLRYRLFLMYFLNKFLNKSNYYFF